MVWKLWRREQLCTCRDLKPVTSGSLHTTAHFCAAHLRRRGSRNIVPGCVTLQHETEYSAELHVTSVLSRRNGPLSQLHRPGLATTLRVRAQTVLSYEDIFARASRKFKKQNKVLESSIIIIIYCIIIIIIIINSAYYNHTV
jgi:hypothetical protein